VPLGSAARERVLYLSATRAGLAPCRGSRGPSAIARSPRPRRSLGVTEGFQCSERVPFLAGGPSVPVWGCGMDAVADFPLPYVRGTSLLHPPPSTPASALQPGGTPRLVSPLLRTPSSFKNSTFRESSKPRDWLRRAMVEQLSPKQTWQRRNHRITE